MLAVLQRVSSARVVVAGKVIGEIARGIAVLASVHADDTEADIQWTAGKLATLRIFPNGEKNFDLDVTQINGGILLVSNFTVAADTRSGRRPSLSPAAGPDVGRVMFDKLIAAMRSLHANVATGEFGADMLVDIQNDGPVTFLIDSRQSR